MNIGGLNRPVQIQKHVMTTDAEGRSSATWTTVAWPFARIEPQTGVETQQAGQEEMTLGLEITIRCRASLALTAAMRVLYKGRPFLITGIVNLAEANEYWVLTCREVRSTGA